MKTVYDEQLDMLLLLYVMDMLDTVLLCSSADCV